MWFVVDPTFRPWFPSSRDLLLWPHGMFLESPDYLLYLLMLLPPFPMSTRQTIFLINKVVALIGLFPPSARNPSPFSILYSLVSWLFTPDQFFRRRGLFVLCSFLGSSGHWHLYNFIRSLSSLPYHALVVIKWVSFFVLCGQKPRQALILTVTLWELSIITGNGSDSSVRPSNLSLLNGSWRCRLLLCQKVVSSLEPITGGTLLLGHGDFTMLYPVTSIESQLQSHLKEVFQRSKKLFYNVNLILEVGLIGW